MRAIVRDFDDDKLDQHVELFRRIVDDVMAGEPAARAEIETHVQYRNMRPYVDAVPYILDAAEEAIRAEGIEPKRTAIRGGTDGSRLSEMGLPTPNLFTGGHEYHSTREWASLQDMASASATVIRLAEVWTRVGEVVSAR
jgi:tripeptide aminopeptidase